MASKVFMYPEEIDQIRFLVSQPENVIEEFCKQISLFVIDCQEINPRMFTSAAKKLGVAPRQVSNSLSALVSFLSRSSDAKLTTEELKIVFIENSLPEHSQPPLLQLYEAIHPILLSRKSSQSKTLESVDWRVDVIAATRSVHAIAEPVISLHLHTNSDSAPLMLQTDAATLQHITAVLEDALQHARSSHHTRLQSALS